jgi:membrane protease YdiL (CAAX protease family)
MVDYDLSRYWRQARAPRYSLSFAFPLLVAYEVLAFTLSHGEYSGVRNGADVLLKSLFLMLGGPNGLTIFGLLLVGGGAAVVWRDRRRGGPVNPRYFMAMAAESIVYATLFGVVAGSLTALLLPGLFSIGSASPAGPAAVSLSLPSQLMISLGAGIYEELLFRVFLVSGLSWLAAAGFGWGRTQSNWFAVAVGALIFSAFHYIGAYGDRFELGSFAFRTVAGLLFSGLYVMRGFGITAWTHALYDVFLAFG